MSETLPSPDVPPKYQVFKRRRHSHESWQKLGDPVDTKADAYNVCSHHELQVGVGNEEWEYSVQHEGEYPKDETFGRAGRGYETRDWRPKRW